MQNNHQVVRRNSRQEPESIELYDQAYPYADSYYGDSVNESTEKQQLFSVLSILKKHWLLIALITILGTSLVIVYEAQKPDIYQASVRVQVNNESNPAAGEGGASSIILNQGSDPTYFATQLQIMEGPGLLRRVVKNLDLEHNPTFFRPGKDQETTVWQNVLRMFGLYRPPARPQTANAAAADDKLELKTDPTVDLDSQAEALAPYVGYIKRNLEVAPVKDSRTATKETRLIQIGYQHYDPVVATKVVNAIADTYVLQNLEQKVQTNASASDFLQKRVAELQSQIRSGEESLINYAKNNQILSLDANQNTVVQRLSDLNTKLSQAEADRITAEAAYKAALQNPLASTTAETKDARTTGLEAQLITLKQQLAQLKVDYTDAWPEVKKVEKQIAAIENELQTNRKRSADTQMSTLLQTYREAASREGELRKNFDMQRSAVLSQNEAAINYRIIQQEIDTNKSLLNNLLQRSRETEVVLNGTPNNVHVVDRALVPGSPNSPQRTKNVVMAFFVSLLGGMAIAFGLNWLDDTIHVPITFQAQLGVPIIGMIPQVGQNGSRSRLLARFSTSKSGNGNENLDETAADSTYNESFEHPLITEAFYQLRTSLLLSTAGGSPKTVLVTSGEPSEGKTITSLNLAKSLAQLGESVLLVDADLRCPKMHLINNISNSSGLSTALTAKELDQLQLDEAIKKEIEPNLDIMTSGPRVPDPANLFSSVQMRSLIERLGASYAYIVIDSPPLLYFADSVILSTEVDAVVLVARADFSSRDVLLRARQKMQDVRGNVVGVVLNDIQLNSFKYYNHTYYKQLIAQEVEPTDGNVLHI
ncbi:MAG: polysaccharide biosynthesis tyrosine autokinase [Pyrinomonadaceae bacterium]|nr:polysaccharide biosynthesis tyrosine autokinase [Pyrinomonadaceae bacterium]